METPAQLVRLIENDPDPEVAILGVDEVLDLIELADKLIYVNRQTQQLIRESLSLDGAA